MRRIATLVAAVTAILVSSMPASAQQISLRMAILGGVGQSAYGEAMTAVPDAVAEATHGRVKIDIFDSLIPPTQLGNAIRDGRIDMIGGVHPFLSGEEPRFTIGHLPGLIRNAAEYKFVLDAYMADVIAEAWAKRYNATALAHGIWYEAPHFSNKPLAALSDFKGLKVRSHNAEAAQMLTAIGAQPTQIPPGEMAGALQRGVIDALSTEYGSAVSLGMQDAAKYMENWEFSVNLGWTVVMNTAVWEKLPNDVRAQISAGMKAFQEARFASYHVNSAKKKEVLLSKGMIWVDVPADEQQKAFTERNVKAIYEGWYDRAKKIGVDGPAIVAKVRQILGK